MLKVSSSGLEQPMPVCGCLCETVTRYNDITQTFCRVRLLYSFSLGTSVPSGGLQGGWTFLDFAEKSF
jgi:hypothetical protein